MTDLASPATEAWLRPVDRDGRVILEAGGAWTVFAVAALRHIHDPAQGRSKVSAIDIAGIDRLDTAGALELLRLQRQYAEASLEGGKPEHRALVELVATGSAGRVTRPARMGWLTHALYEL